MAKSRFVSDRFVSALAPLVAASVLVALPNSAEGRTVSTATSGGSKTVTFDGNRDGIVDSRAVLTPTESQLFVDIDQDGDWDHWEIKSGSTLIELSNPISGKFTRAVITRKSGRQFNVLNLRYSYSMRAYVVANHYTRHAKTHRMDKYDSLFGDESPKRQDTDANCGSGRSTNTILNLAESVRAPIVEAEAANLRRRKLIDESCLQLTGERKTYDVIVNALAKMTSGMDRATDSFLTCVSDHGWNIEAARMRAFLSNPQLLRERPIIRCELPNSNSSLGKFDESTGTAVFRDVPNQRKAQELIVHENLLHGAARLAEESISKIERCCSSESVNRNSSSCETAKEQAPRLGLNLLRGLINEFRDYPEIQDLILDIYEREGDNGIQDIASAFRTIVVRTIESALPQECRSRANHGPPTCQRIWADRTKIFLNEFHNSVCSREKGRACTAFNQKLESFKLASADKCFAHRTNCFSLASIDSSVSTADPGIGTTGTALFGAPLAAQAQELGGGNSASRAPAQVSATPPALGPRVNLDNPREARAAIRQAQQQSFAVYQAADDVYQHVAQTAGFGRPDVAAAESGGSEPTAPSASATTPTRTPSARTSRTSSTETLDTPIVRMPTNARPQTSKQPTFDSSAPQADARPVPTVDTSRLNPQTIVPGVPSASIGTPGSAPASGASGAPAFIPASEATTRASAGRGKAANASAERPPATLLGIPIAMVAPSVAYAAPLPLPGANRGVAPTSGSNPNARAGAGNTPGTTDYMPRLKQPYSEVRSLLENSGERTKVIRYLNEQGIQIRPPRRGAPLGSAQPKTRIIYPDETSEPEVRRVGR